MATASGWTDRTFGSPNRGRSKARPAPRSLGAALREAGLADAAPDPRDDDRNVFRDEPTDISRLEAASALAASRSPRLGFFSEQLEQLPRVITNASPHQSVVSPPPWLRAKRRSRWQARMLNAFGWVMTILVAGSIIGVAAHYLGIPPAGGIATMQARQ